MRGTEARNIVPNVGNLKREYRPLRSLEYNKFLVLHFCTVCTITVARGEQWALQLIASRRACAECYNNKLGDEDGEAVSCIRVKWGCIFLSVWEALRMHSNFATATTANAVPLAMQKAFAIYKLQLLLRMISGSVAYGMQLLLQLEL
jgi:hypothetical protein